MTQRHLRVWLPAAACFALLEPSAAARAEYGRAPTWSPIERDWGPYRFGTRVEVDDEALVLMPAASPRGYFPATGRRPRYGRHEVLRRPPRRAPAAVSYRRVWSAASDPLGFDPIYPPRDPPPVIPAPRWI